MKIIDKFFLNVNVTKPFEILLSGHFKKNDILYPDYGYHNGLIILNTPFYNNPSIVYNVIGVDDLKHIEFLFKYEKFLKLF